MKLIDRFFSLSYNYALLPVVRKVNSEKSSRIPKVELSGKNVRNAKLLTTRDELLTLLPKGGVVAELGVDEGEFSEAILSINKPQKLHLVDCWGSKRYNQDKRKKVENRFKEQRDKNVVEINLGLSTTVAQEFQDNYFDWIYIDTSHSYDTTIKELELYRTKVKSKGYIAGHDYIVGNWNGSVRYGVIEAVHEFCVKYNWEIVFLTSEINKSPSFAIREITADTNEN